MRARVGAMPQPKRSHDEQPKVSHDEQPQGRGGRASRARVQSQSKSGMSLQDLKRQTAYRLAQEQSDGGGGGGAGSDTPDDGSPGGALGAAATIGGSAASQQSSPPSAMHFQPQHHPQPPPPGHQHTREPHPHYGPRAAGGGAPGSSPYPPQRGVGVRHYAAPPPPPQSYGYDASPPPPGGYCGESRNYTDSQLGVGGQLGVVGGGGVGGVPAQFGSPSQAPAPSSGFRPAPPPQQQQPLQQQNYSTPRMPRHGTVLKDRGSAENSVGSDPSWGSDGHGGHGHGGGGRSGGGAAAKASPVVKGRTGPRGKDLNKVGGASSAKAYQKEMRSPDGGHSPARDRHNIEGQVLFATPNQRRSAPSAPFSEPPRRNRPHQNMSPNYNRMRSPDHHGGGYSKGGGGGFYGGKNHHHNSKHHQSKLPHGLTVQELKEMTRARLAAEAEVGGPEGSSDQSVHSAGTHGSSKGSEHFSSGMGVGPVRAQTNEPVTLNLVQSNESVRRNISNQGLNSLPYRDQQQQQMHQMQQQQQQNPPQYTYPRHPSPVFGSVPGRNPNQYNRGQPKVARQLSPTFGLSSSQTRSQGEAWETASAASSTLASDFPEPAFGNNGPGMAFSSPVSDSNSMPFNRGRCFSAGAVGTGVPPSFEQQQAAYYEAVPLAGAANLQRCATVSPPGMSRLHEDRPFPFSAGDKERLAIPPLSEPRLRLHSTGGLNTNNATVRAFGSEVSSPPPRSGAGNGSAFVPIGKAEDRFLPQSPPPLAVDRSKFGVNDRTISTGSAASGHGDLPSSMAEAVLESITSASGAPIGGQVIGSSPFRLSKTNQDMAAMDSPFRVPSDSENTSSAFRMDGLLPETSGNRSLFSSGESRNIFSPEGSGGERLLLGTHSWGGIEDETVGLGMGLSHDFGSLLDLSGDNNGPALRGRAATEPVWYGGNDPHLVSRMDPELHGEERGI